MISKLLCIKHSELAIKCMFTQFCPSYGLFGFNKNNNQTVSYPYKFGGLDVPCINIP